MPYDPTRDPYASFATSALSPARRLAAMVPSDATDLPRYGCLKVGGAGTVVLSPPTTPTAQPKLAGRGGRDHPRHRPQGARHGHHRDRPPRPHQLRARRAGPLNSRSAAPSQGSDLRRAAFPYLPTELGSRLAGWWDADDGASITLATSMSQWADKSGNSRHLGQATPSLQPVPSAGSLNGRAGIAFNRAYLTCLAASAPVTTAMALVIIASNDTASSNNRGIAVLYPNGATADYNSASAIVALEQMANGSYQSYAVNLVGVNSGAGIAGAGGRMLATENDGANAFAFRPNGALSPVAGTTIAAVNLSTATTIMLGGRNVGGPNVATYGYVGTLHVILLVNGALSEAERQKLEGYLASKWGLQALLPAAHPYKSATP